MTSTRCRHCDLVQFVAPKCRRCHRAMLLSPSMASPTPFAELAILPTLAELEAALMREALRRSRGHVAMAGAMIGVPKTTMYRKLAGVQS